MDKNLDFFWETEDGFLEKWYGRKWQQVLFLAWADSVNVHLENGRRACFFN